jgi:hypothetical protein
VIANLGIYYRTILSNALLWHKQLMIDAVLDLRCVAYKMIQLGLGSKRQSIVRTNNI